LARAIGSTDMPHPRGSMSLANVVYQSTSTWANPLMVELERQAQVPQFGDDPVEMGHTSQEPLVARLRERPAYESLFAAAFPDAEQPFTTINVVRAIASFERTLISGNSAFDRYNNGDPTALSESAKRGEQLFNSEGFECFHCHGGFN